MAANLMSQSMTDIFPNEVTTSVSCILSYPEENFKLVDSACNVRVFVQYLDASGKIYFHKRKFEGKYVDHVKYVGANCMRFQDFRPYAIKWRAVATKLKRTTIACDQGSVDQRAGYKMGNRYLVKFAFTFGQKTVRPGTAHVYQVLKVPLLFLLLEETTRTQKCGGPLTIGDRLFPYREIPLYDRRVLPANGVYRVPPGTTYLIFSTQKNFFSLDVVTEDAPLPFDVVVDPVRDRETTSLAKYFRPNHLPVRTPHIDSNEEDRLEEEEAVRYVREQQQQQQQSSVYGQPAFEWIVVPERRQQFIIETGQPRFTVETPPIREETETAEETEMRFIETPVLEEAGMRPVETPVLEEAGMRPVETPVLEEAGMHPTREETERQRRSPEPVVIQRNVCTVTLPFVEYYGCLARKTYGDPRIVEGGVRSDDRIPAVPLNLSSDMDFVDLEEGEMDENEHEMYDSMMRDLQKCF